PGYSWNAAFDLVMMMRRYLAACPDIHRHAAIGSIMWAGRPPSLKAEQEPHDPGQGKEFVYSATACRLSLTELVSGSSCPRYRSQSASACRSILTPSVI